LEGERDPWTLATFVEPEVKAKPEDIAKSLEGNWREELLFVLRQHVELYRIYQDKITDCDLQLRKHLESLGSKVDLKTQPIGNRPKGKKKSKNAPGFDLRTELYRITGIDWTQINGIDVFSLKDQASFRFPKKIQVVQSDHKPRYFGRLVASSPKP